ncbi:signal peptidase II [Patescibacteria group bacterium]|nr:signal peptidase II [Patescibacteria group bacterium]MBU1953237.1 signal peptidase II [Patescibacteria group bacterium]
MSFLSKLGFDFVLNCTYPFSKFLTLEQFLFLGLLALTISLYFLFPYLLKHRLGIIAMFLLVAGGLLNGVERLATGCVKDYFNFFNLFHFNIADLIINTGILVSVYILCKKK